MSQSKTIKEMIEYINQENIRYYCDLFDYAAEHKPHWFRALVDYATPLLVDYIELRKTNV